MRLEDELGMPAEWALSVVVPIFKGIVTSGTMHATVF